VIATRLPGIMKEFGHNNGVIYVDTPTDVLKKVVELHSDDRATRKWGTIARKFVEKYSWDKITDEFENILRAEVQKH
jgi:glycosyltransferase involved in cell wall biosynthesis